MCRNEVQFFSVTQEKQTVEPGAQLHGTPQNRLEDRLQVRRRATDYFQDFGSGGLLIKGFPGLIEEPHILNRDHGLVSEGLEQHDLLARERASLAAGGGDHSDGPSIADYRHDEERSGTQLPCAFPLRLGQRWLCLSVGDIENHAVPCDLCRERTVVERNRICARELVTVLAPREMERREMQLMIQNKEGAAIERVGQSCGSLGDRVEHRLHVGRRARDHTKDLARRRLPLQGLFRLVEETAILDGDDGLGGERLDESDFLLGKRPNLHADKHDDAD